MNHPAASVIVRAMNKADVIERALSALRSQTVPVEIIVVDSGSTDGTLEIARRHCDRLIEIRPEEFTYGYALNLGAAAATAPIHFALSAHCHPERADWVQRALSYYERPDVAGTCYAKLDEVVYQDLALLEADPFFGLSSHASSWRGSLWERVRFNETLESAEDREWSLRVLREGWVIAMDPDLGIGTPHRTAHGMRHWYRISRRDVRAIATFMALPDYTPRDALRDWHEDVRLSSARSGLRARASPWRMLAALAKYHGIRDGAQVRRGQRPPWRPPARQQDRSAPDHGPA